MKSLIIDTLRGLLQGAMTDDPADPVNEVFDALITECEIELTDSYGTDVFTIDGRLVINGDLCVNEIKNTQTPDRPDGALPPPDCAWQVGKTAATIQFVQGFDKYLRGQKGRNEYHILEKLVTMAKEGTLVLTDHVDFD